MALPPAQTQTLDYLSQQNLLSGVPPSVLGAIDTAESSGQGGAINSSGYGGWFGLGAGTPYPGGYQIPASEMSSTGWQSFVDQAEATAAEFQGLLASHGGNVYAAERAYQGGGNEGTNVFAAQGVPLYVAPSAITPAGTAQAADAQLAGTLSGIWGSTGSPSAGGAQAAPVAYLPGTNWHIPGTGPGGQLLPGWASGPLDALGSSIGSGIKSALGAVARPLENYLADAGLVIFGIIALIVALVLAAKASGGAPAAPPGGRGDRDAEGGGEAGGEAAEAAAVAA